MPNLTPPHIQLTIAGVDFTQELMGGSISRARWNERSGLMPIRGNLTLIELDGGQSLDPYQHPEIFNRGKLVQLEVFNGSEYVPHQFGQTYITELEYSEQGRQLDIGLACIIGYTLNEGKTDARDTGYRPPGSRSFTSVVNSLLLKIQGCPPLSGTLGFFYIDDTINVSNYWTAIGDLAFSAGKAIYASGEGKLLVRTPPTGGEAQKTITLGDSEVEFSPVSGIEFPPGIIRVTGNRVRTTASNALGFNRETETIYGPAYAIGDDEDDIIPLEKITTIERVSGRKQEREIIHEIALGKALSNLPVQMDGKRAAFVLGEKSTETRYFERLTRANEEGDGGKLQRVTRYSTAANPFALKAYTDWLFQTIDFEVAIAENITWISFLSAFIAEESMLEDYEEIFSYTSDNTLKTKLSTLRSQIGDFASGYDWARVLNFSDSVDITTVGNTLTAAKATATQQEVEEKWLEIAKDRFYKYQRKERRAMGALGHNSQVKNHRALGALVKTSDKSVKGSQVRPPDPGRAPDPYEREEKAYKYEKLVETPFPSALSENERVVNVPYLNWNNTGQQAELIADQFAAYLLGRAQSVRAKTGFDDDLIGIKPLPIFDVVRPDGEVRVYVADQETHIFEPTAYMVAFNLVHLGSRVAAGVTEPFRKPAIASSDDEVTIEPDEDGSYPNEPSVTIVTPDDDTEGTAIIRLYKNVEVVQPLSRVSSANVGLEVFWSVAPSSESIGAIERLSNIVITTEVIGGDDLPSGTYTFNTTGTSAAGGSGCGFTIFQVHELDTYSGLMNIVQAGSTAIYRDGTDYSGAVAVDISTTINKCGQIGTWLIVPFAGESGSTRYYDIIGVVSGSGEMIISSASPVEAAVLVAVDQLISFGFGDFDGNTIGYDLNNVNLAVITEAGETVALTFG